VYSLPEVIITGNTHASVNLFPQTILAIYILVSCLLLIRILFQIGTIAYKIYHTVKTVLQGQTVYESSGLETPFSFFRWIVLDSSRYSDMELQEILLHESAHSEENHSIDTLLAELLCAFCWFNPFAWLLKTEIRMNLEFLADRSVLTSGCGAEHYQFHLLRLSYHKAAAKITNNFNVSLLKKRIFMMNKKQTPYRSIWKYALILPIVAMLVFFNSACQMKSKQDAKMETTQPEPANAQQESAINPQDSTNFRQEADNTQDSLVNAKESNPIFTHVEVMPQFPGGNKVLLKWLADNIVYPEEAQAKGIQGIVNLRFVIKPDGSVSNVEVIKGLDPICDKEAVRVAKKMPNWIPGKQNGNLVYVYFNLPILFRLQR
jgi:TonB family protein